MPSEFMILYSLLSSNGYLKSSNRYLTSLLSIGIVIFLLSKWVSVAVCLIKKSNFVTWFQGWKGIFSQL